MKKELFAASASVAILAGLAGSPVFAQSATKPAEVTTASDENVIVVTARRRAESVQDVPFVIDAISADKIQQRGISSVADIAKFTPGLTFDRGISLQDTRPAIRGLPGTRGRQPVGILLDGIDISTEALGNAGGGTLVNARFMDLERIEVVKGPQSALYGRAAFAGAINYISKRPSKTMEAEVKASFASFNTYELGASVSGPLVNDKLGFRANIMKASSDGDKTNPVSGAKLNSYDTSGGAFALNYDDGAGLTVFGRATYAQNQYSQSAIHNLSGFTNETSRLAASTPEGTAVAKGFAGGALTSALVSYLTAPGELKFTQVTGLSIDPTTGKDFPGLKGHTTTFTLNAAKQLGTAQLVYNGGYVKQKETLGYDGDFYGVAYRTDATGSGEPLNIFDAVNFANDLQITSHEIRIQDLDSKPLRWAVGALYWQSDMKQQNSSLRAISGFPLNPYLGGVPASAARSGSFLYNISAKKAWPYGRKTESSSVYGLVEYDFTAKLTAGVEGRYIKEKTTVIRSDFVQAAFAPVSASFINPVQTATVNDNAFVPRASVNYHMSPDMLIYASVGKGFKPAGVSELDLASTLKDSRYKSESVVNYEAGVKSTLLDRQLVLNGALFFMDWKDKQVSQLVEDATAPSGFRASVRNAGAAKVKGLDLSAVVRPNFAPNLTFDWAYTFLDTEYTDFTVASNSNFTVGEAANCTLGKVGPGKVCFVPYNGKQLERAPKHQMISNVNYTVPLQSGVKVLLDGSVQYMGERFLSEDNRMVMPSYVNLDLSVGLEFGTVNLQAFVTNATEDDTVRNAQANFDLATFGRSINIYSPPPRVFGIRGRAKF